MSDRIDLLACVLAREIGDDDVVGVGLGTPLALCAALAARRSHASTSVVLVAGAVSPDVGLLECLRGPSSLTGKTPGFVPHLDTMDMAERQAMTLQFLRPAQVDGRGSTNTSRVRGRDSSTVRFPGGLATADVPCLLPRLVLYHTAHEPRSLPTKLDFVTGAGGGVNRSGYEARGPSKLITDRCVITFGEGAPRIGSVHAGERPDEVKASTGFNLDFPDDIPVTEAPDTDELAALEAVDPHRLRELEFRSTRKAAAERLDKLRRKEGTPDG